jgi:F0F1-type ATP synthase beta subunit
MPDKTTGHGYPLWLNRQTHPERRGTVTRLKDYNAIQDVVELLAHDGFDNLGEAIRRIINEAMRLERQNYLGVSAPMNAANTAEAKPTALNPGACRPASAASI